MSALTPLRGDGSTLGGLLPTAAAEDGGTMASRHPWRIDGVVCASPTAGPMGLCGHHLGPHAIAGGVGCALPRDPGGHEGGLAERVLGGGRCGPQG